MKLYIYIYIYYLILFFSYLNLIRYDFFNKTSPNYLDNYMIYILTYFKLYNFFNVKLLTLIFYLYTNFNLI